MRQGEEEISDRSARITEMLPRDEVTETCRGIPVVQERTQNVGQCNRHFIAEQYELFSSLMTRICYDAGTKQQLLISQVNN